METSAPPLPPCFKMVLNGLLGPILPTSELRGWQSRLLGLGVLALLLSLLLVTPERKPHMMDSIGIPIKLLKQLDLINNCKEAQNPLQAVLCSWCRLRSCRVETCLLYSLWHQGCLGAHDFPTNWAGACSPHPNTEGFPWQLMHMWMDLWLNGTDLTYSRAQWDGVNPFTFSVSAVSFRD